MHISTDLDQRIRQVRTHESVRTRDQHRAAGIGVAELTPQILHAAFSVQIGVPLTDGRLATRSFSPMHKRRQKPARR